MAFLSLFLWGKRVRGCEEQRERQGGMVKENRKDKGWGRMPCIIRRSSWVGTSMRFFIKF